MTTTEYLASSDYRDFIDINGMAYIIPSGFGIDPSPVETANVKTMASGRKRRDLIRVGTKFKFSWKNASSQMYRDVSSIFVASLAITPVTMYLRKELPTSTEDYEVHEIDIIYAPKYKPMFRGTTVFIYESLTLEME